MESQELVLRLMNEAKMTPQEISEALDLRVSSRTVYRWSKGESTPQQQSDLDALRELSGKKFGPGSPLPAEKAAEPELKE